jgi:hypothetical protein
MAFGLFVHSRAAAELHVNKATLAKPKRMEPFLLVLVLSL